MKRTNSLEKSILLFTPLDFELHKRIKKNFEYLGYNIVNVLDQELNFQYKNNSDRVKKFFRRNLLGDHNYKNKLRQEHRISKQIERINSNENYAYAIVFRPDLFDKSVLCKAKEKSAKLLAYHNDSIYDYAGLFDNIDLFDAFFISDKNDVKQLWHLPIGYLPFFYFDYVGSLPQTPINRVQIEEKYYPTILYIYHISTVNEVIRLHRELRQIGFEVNIQLVYENKNLVLDEIPSYAKENFHLIETGFPFDMDDTILKKADVLLDLPIKGYYGNHLFLFEGLFYGKKVLTKDAKEKDIPFYTKENVMFLDEKDSSPYTIADFLRSPIKCLDSNLIEEFSFTNWEKQLHTDVKKNIDFNTPLVSIIIPCYNNAKYVKEAIDSCWQQTYKKVEIIVVDDGSSDNSYEEVRNIIAGVSNTIVITQSNGGPSSARNNGFKHSHGDFVMFLDADDKLHADFVDECLSAFRQNPQYNVVYCDSQYFGLRSDKWKLEDYDKNVMLFNNMIPVFAMTRASVFEAVGMFDTNIKYAEDWELWLRVTTRFGGVHRIPKTLFYYRKRVEKDSLSDHESLDDFYNISYNYIFFKHKELYKASGLTIPRLLYFYKNAFQNNDHYKDRYYNEWYRKLFYFLLKRNRYKELYKKRKKYNVRK